MQIQYFISKLTTTSTNNLKITLQKKARTTLSGYLNNEGEPIQFVIEHLFLHFDENDISAVDAELVIGHLREKAINVGNRQKYGKDIYYELECTKEKIDVICGDLNHELTKAEFNEQFRHLESLREIDAVLLFHEESIDTLERRDTLIDKLLNNLRAWKIKALHFLDCHVTALVAQKTDKDVPMRFRRCVIGNCTLEGPLETEVDQRRASFEQCEIGKCLTRGDGGRVDFRNSTVNLLINRSKSKITYLNLDKLNVVILQTGGADFDRVTVKYDMTSSLSWRHWRPTFERTPTRNLWMSESFTVNQALNSFIEMRALRGLQSEQSEIDRYIDFFHATNHRPRKILFAYNGGYFKLLWPALGIVLSLLGSKYIIDTFNLYRDTSRSMSLLVNPKELITEVILRDFHLDFTVSIPKIGVALLMAISIYSMFSFLAAARRRLGFSRYKVVSK